MSSSSPLGLIGIGLLGSALAERLIGGGFAVLGYDLDPGRLAEFGRRGGTAANDAAAVLAACPRVLLCLPSHREVNELIERHAATLRPGQIVIDTTTGDPASSEQLARELSARAITYLDATLSGSSVQVRAGAASLMVGGDASAFAACGDIFARLGGNIHHTGPAGTGARMKLVTNLTLGLNRAALAEGLALAEALGLDPTQALAIMRQGPAYSRIMDGKGEKMISGDFTPQARLSQHLKDVRLIVACGRAAGLPMTLSDAHRALLESAEAAGLGSLDNSAIIQVLRARSGGTRTS